MAATMAKEPSACNWTMFHTDVLLNKLNRIWLAVFNSSADLDLKDTNYIFRDQDVSPPSLTLYNSGDIFMQKEHVDLTQVLDASQISLICSIISLHFALSPGSYL